MIDKDLQESEIQSLSGPDQIATFFAALGYNVDRRISQTPANLGITAETLIRQISRIELLADQEGSLQVYLFELSSVTIAATRSLARTFRNLAGNFLLVLTSDYERIDFVLVEKLLPSRLPKGPMGQIQVVVRPRVLTVERRKPGRVHLRVLRRFTYTESDPDAQYEKLLSAYAMADWSEDFFNNRALFSDYYLLERLRDHAVWRDDPKPAYQRFQDLYAQVRSRWAGRTEQEIRTGLLVPAFEILGFVSKEEKAAAEGQVEPDYRLYSSSNERDPVALCLAYPWGRFLDGKDETRGSKTPEENPGALVVSLLEQGRTDWAIVTNGKHWRLYSAKAHSHASDYYEIDLEEVLAQDDPAESFRYFWLLFRCPSFEPFKEIREGEKHRTTLLDVLLQGSEDYAKRLGERLKGRVFEQIFPHFAEGFIEYIRQRDGLNADLSQPVLDRIFEGTLAFLYRLLFLLYAEARDLLPVKEIRGYSQKSLTGLKREVVEIARDETINMEERLRQAYRADRTDLYDRLMDLFRIVDLGDANLNVPVYNGGLFLTEVAPEDYTSEAENARVLLRHKIPDRFLALGLESLARDEDEKTFKRVFIDYKSLGVRQLGSIYEGLLEFKLRIAPERMAIVRGKKSEEIVPYREAKGKNQRILTQGRGGDAKERTLSKGKVYLENDKRERKATGSYYTPDYIVKYIVEHTVGPVLKDKFEAVAPKIREAQKKYRQRLVNLKAMGKSLDEDQLARTYGRKVVDELFDVKVLDPAMGSGHFLVEAVDFVTDQMIDFLNGFPWNPVFAMLQETRETILGEMDEQSITIDTARLTDVNLLKRHVLKRCLYGVDLNPMAVELAKVSLWLNSFTLGAPLSFLDHHLKCGNSLIGAVDIQEYIAPGSKREQDLIRILQHMVMISELSDATATEIRRSGSLYEDARRLQKPFKQAFNVSIAQHFTKIDSPGITASIAFGIEGMPHFSRQFEEAQNIAAKRRFFHWKIEFPEVFYNLKGEKGNPGFDAVVGNPPYVGFHGFEEVKKYLREAFVSCRGKFDIYVPFWERGILLTRKGGKIAYISPSGFMKRDHGVKLRKTLTEQNIQRIHDFEHICVFEGAINYTCILVVEKSSPQVNTNIVLSRGIDIYSTFEGPSVEGLDAKGWSLQPNEGYDLSRFKNASYILTLKDVAEVIGEGIVTGKNDVFLLTNNSSPGRTLQNEPVVVKALRGQDVDRYEINWDGTLLIYPYEYKGKRTIPINEREIQERSQDTYGYLMDNRNRLAGRSWFENSSKKWYELWNQRDIIHHSTSKLIVQENSVRIEFVWDDGEFFYLDTCCGISISEDSGLNEWFCLAVLNSLLLDVYYRALTVPKAEGHFIHKPMFLRRLPIRYIHFSTPTSERLQLFTKAKCLYESCMNGKDADRVLDFVEFCLPKDKKGDFLAFKEGGTGAEEKSDVVHDLLAFLARQMIELNRQKQAEMKRFLGWLKAELHIAPDRKGNTGIEALTGKTKLRNYLGNYQKGKEHLSFEALMDILVKNRGRIGQGLSGRTFGARLQREYKNSLEKLLPIKECLTKTDWLIDQIVYRLYGLTEEEIKIVEGKQQ